MVQRLGAGLVKLGATTLNSYLTKVIGWTPEMFEGFSDKDKIQLAIDNAGISGGGNVILGAGIYRADNIVLKPMVQLIGQGVTQTTIKARDNWSGLAVLSSIRFVEYAAQGTTKEISAVERTTSKEAKALTHFGSYGASISGIHFDGNYDSFAGTPGKFEGLGLAVAGITHVKDIEVYHAPATGLVHLSFEGSPNSRPDYWPEDKGLYSVNEHSNICVKWCGNDCMYIQNYDSIYSDIISGFAGRGGGTVVASHWDHTRSCTMAHFAGSCNIRKGHFYGHAGGWGIVLGHGDYNSYYGTYKYENIICESIGSAMWARPTAQVQGVSADFHNVAMAVTLPEFGTVAGPYTPGCVIQSGQFIAGKQASRQLSDFGRINFWNFTVSGSNPAVGFRGVHVYLGGENNSIELQLHRSRFLDPALGGIGVMLAGIGNIIKHGSMIVGFLDKASDGSDSCAIQVQPGSQTDVDVAISRCNIGMRWSFSSNKPHVTGRIRFRDNIVGSYFDSSYQNADLLQHSRLEVHTPTGSNRLMFRGAESIAVTNTGQQTVTVECDLPYVPSLEAVHAWLVNTNQPQGLYTNTDYIQYDRPASTRTRLVFRVKVPNTAGAAAGIVLVGRVG